MGSSTADAHSKKIREHNKFQKSVASDSDEDSLSGVLETNIQDFEDSIAPYTVLDNRDFLLGPELKVAQLTETPSLYAYAYHDIFDKKAAQKLLRFFVYGFPNVEPILQSWVIVSKKNDQVTLNRLHYYYANKLDIVQDAEDFFSERVQPLTHAQRTETVASRITNSAHPMDNATILEMLLSSWFSRSRCNNRHVD